MIRPCLGFLSLAEFGLCVAYFSMMPYDDVSWYLALASIFAEPLLYYLFASYVAMRGVLTTMEMTARLMSLPIYYGLLLVLTLTRLDLHQAKYLNNLLHYDFNELVYAKQLILHIGLFTLPQLVVLVINQSDFTKPLTVTVLVILSLALLSYFSTVCAVLRNYSRHKTLRYSRPVELLED